MSFHAALRKAVRRIFLSVEEALDGPFGGADNPLRHLGAIGLYLLWIVVGSGLYLYTVLDTGIDAVYIGPSDLSLSLGCKPVFDDVDPPVAQAIDHNLARAKAHGIRAGVHNGRTDVARARIAKGFDFVTVSSDARILIAGSQQIVSEMRAPGSRT